MLKQGTIRPLIRGATLFWALGALAATYHILSRYPVGQIWPVAAAAGLAALVFVTPDRWRLASAIAAGIAVRIAAYSTIAQPPLDDPGSYFNLASNILSGRGMVVANETYGTLWAAFPPAYPLMLAAAGLQWLALNLLFDLVAAWAIYRLSSSPTAAAVYFLFPGTILASVVPSKESLAVALVLLLPLVRNPWLFGALAGALVLAQPAWAPIPLIFFIVARRTGWWKALAATVLVLSPWWVRNYLLFGEFVPLTSSAGLSLAVAVEGRHLSTLAIPGDEIRRASVVASAALNHIIADPLHYLGNVVRMLIRSFLVDDDPYEYLTWSHAAWLGAAALAGQLAWAALIAAAALTRRSIPPWLLALILAAAVSCAAGIWLEFSSRHRAFVIPLLILVATGRSGREPGSVPAAH